MFILKIKVIHHSLETLKVDIGLQIELGNE